MQYIYDKLAGSLTLEIKDENYNYIIKARRHKLDDYISFRNLQDDFLYVYKIIEINKKNTILELLNKEEKN